jgi:hypothetical protein
VLLPFLFVPIFLGFALHRWRVRVLELQPIFRSTGAVGRAKALRYDAFESEPAGVGENGRAVALDMFVEPN